MSQAGMLPAMSRSLGHGAGIARRQPEACCSSAAPCCMRMGRPRGAPTAHGSLTCQAVVGEAEVCQRLHSGGAREVGGGQRACADRPWVSRLQAAAMQHSAPLPVRQLQAAAPSHSLGAHRSACCRPGRGTPALPGWPKRLAASLQRQKLPHLSCVGHPALGSVSAGRAVRRGCRPTQHGSERCCAPAARASARCAGAGLTCAGSAVGGQHTAQATAVQNHVVEGVRGASGVDGRQRACAPVAAREPADQVGAHARLLPASEPN